MPGNWVALCHKWGSSMFRLRLFLAACAVFCVAYITHAAPAFAQAACFPEDSLTDDFVVGAHSGTLNCLSSKINYTGTITAGPPQLVFNPVTGTNTLQIVSYNSAFTGNVVGDGTVTLNGSYNELTNLGSFTTVFSSGGSLLTTFNGNTNVAHITGTYLGQTLNCTIDGSSGGVYFSGACGDLAIGGFSGLASAKTNSTGRTQEVVLNNVLATPVQTEQEKQAEQEQPSRGNAPTVRLFLADLSVQSNQFAGQKSAITGVTIGTTIEFDNNLKVGALVPVDRLFNPGTDGTRGGVLAYAQYNYRFQGEWSVKPTIFANYMYTSPDKGSGISTYGGGGGVSLTRDLGNLEPSLVGVINYNKDSGAGGGAQTLAAIGPRLGIRVGGNWVYEIGAMWNQEVTGAAANGERSFYDATAGISYRISDTFRVNAAYSTTLGITQFHSHRFSFGGRFVF